MRLRSRMQRLERRAGADRVDMLSTLRRVSWEEKIVPLLPKHGVLKMQVVRLLEFVSHTG